MWGRLSQRAYSDGGAQFSLRRCFMADQSQRYEPYAKRWIRGLATIARCDWCANTGRMSRVGLCRACNEVRKSLFKLREQSKSRKIPVGSNARFWYTRKLVTLRNMKRLCISDGDTLRRILAGEVSSL